MNPAVRITAEEVLSDEFYTLRKVAFEYRRSDGKTQAQSREVYEPGNGATILLYNRAAGTIVLTRQFRMAAYQNGHETGQLLETPAGLLDEDSPEEAIRRETEEETGYRLSEVRKAFDLFMSPGNSAERLYFFVAEYDPNRRVNEGGGTDAEEDIEVLEVPFVEALRQVESGDIQDAKTVLLLQYAQLNRLLA